MAEKPLAGQAPLLAGQGALVTGGAKRVGRAIALALAGAGAKVAVNYRTSEAEARETVEQIKKCGSEGVALQADVSRPEEAGKLVAAAEEKLGAVNILVNNAGIFDRGEWDKVSEAEWDRFMGVNLKAQFFTAQAAAPGMKRRGRGKIINLASLGGLRVWSGYIPYSVSKAGVIHLTRLLARALAPEVQVNAIAPGTIQFEGEEPDANYVRRAPLGRTGAGEDIAQTALFLCTRAEFITGQVFVVDGGYSLT